MSPATGKGGNRSAEQEKLVPDIMNGNFMAKLTFKELSLEDRALIDPYLQQDGEIMSDRCFASLYIWGEHYRLKYVIAEDSLIFRTQSEDGRYGYYMPLGNMKAGIAAINEDAQHPYSIYLVTKDGKDEMEKVFPEQFAFEEQREDFDYLYNAQSLISLSGKKLHSKRNFINRFLSEYEGQWQYTSVDPVGDYEEIMMFLREWCMGRDDEEDDCEDYRFEYSAIRRALKNYNALGIKGGIIRLNGKIIAFTLAAPQNERAMDILIEKADGEIVGAYPMINNLFAKENCQGFELINREEDMGIEGLRKAKLSYNPVALTEKYKAVSVK